MNKILKPTEDEDRTDEELRAYASLFLKAFVSIVFLACIWIFFVQPEIERLRHFGYISGNVHMTQGYIRT